MPRENINKLDWVSINPEYLIRVYDRMVDVYGTKVLYLSRAAAAGMAAVHAINQTKNDVHSIDVKFLRKRLKGSVDI